MYEDTISPWQRTNKLSPLGKVSYLIIFLVLFVYAMWQVPHAMSYDQEAYKYQLLYERGGCHWESCPQREIDKMVEEHNGLYPPSHYEYDTKDYWRSYCTYTRDLPDKWRCK